MRYYRYHSGKQSISFKLNKNEEADLRRITARICHGVQSGQILASAYESEMAESHTQLPWVIFRQLYANKSRRGHVNIYGPFLFECGVFLDHFAMRAAPEIRDFIGQEDCRKALVLANGLLNAYMDLYPRRPPTECLGACIATPKSNPT